MNYRILLLLVAAALLGACGEGDDGQTLQELGETVKDAGQAAQEAVQSAAEDAGQAAQEAGQAAQDAVQSATEEAGDMADNLANAGGDSESGKWNPEATDVQEEKAPNGKIVDSGLGYEYVVVEHPDEL